MDLPTTTRITVKPTGASLGADVTGVDLCEPVDQATFKAIEDAWHQHLVLRFRGQHLDDPRFLAFARRFGELDKAPIHAKGDAAADPYPEITVMSNITGAPVGEEGCSTRSRFRPPAATPASRTCTKPTTRCPPT